jgi:hypothetical protein
MLLAVAAVLAVKDPTSLAPITTARDSNAGIATDSVVSAISEKLSAKSERVADTDFVIPFALSASPMYLVSSLFILTNA